MAGGLLPFVFVMLVLSVAQWAIGRRSVAPAVGTRYRKVRGAVSLTVVIAVLSVAAAVLSVVQTVRIGESGSRAAWHGHFSPTAISRGGS
jgi:phosphate/sulfate permease